KDEAPAFAGCHKGKFSATARPRNGACRRHAHFLGPFPGKRGSEVAGPPGAKLVRMGEAPTPPRLDREIDLLLPGPFLADLRHSRVGAGHPMVPEADVRLPAAPAVCTKGCRQRCCRRGSRRLQQLAARDWL